MARKTKTCKACGKHDNIVYLCGSTTAEPSTVNLSVGHELMGVLINCTKCKFCPECGKRLEDDARIIE